MVFEDNIRTMKEALEENPRCGYAKNHIRHETLSDGRTVNIQLLIEIELDDPVDSMN